MRPFPFAICLLSLFALTALSLRYYNSLNRDSAAQSVPRHTNSSGRAVRAKPPTPARPPAGVSEGGPAEQQPQKPEGPAATARPLPKLTAERIDSIRAALARWQFEETDGDALAEAKHDEVAGALLQDWILRRAFHRRASEVAATGPEDYLEIKLENGKTLWASEANTAANGVQLTLPNGIRFTLAEWEVKKSTKRSRAEYFAATQGEYASMLSAALAGNAAALVRAAALALARQDYAATNGVFEAWRAKQGSKELAKLLPPEKESGENPQADVAGAPRIDGMAAGGADKPPGFSDSNLVAAIIAAKRPGSKHDLIEKIRDVKESIAQRRVGSKTMDMIDSLLLWEEWLETDGKVNGIDVEESRKLRREIQFLRLDLLKMGEI